MPDQHEGCHRNTIGLVEIAQVGRRSISRVVKRSLEQGSRLRPTMITGIYGMNFDNMPELHWEYGYPMILDVMATVCGFVYYTFKKSGWL